MSSTLNNIFPLETLRGDLILFHSLRMIAIKIKPLLFNLVVEIKKGGKNALEYEFEIDKINSLFNSFDKKIDNIEERKSILNNQDPKKEFLPTSVILLPTYQCNLKCIYCYANSRPTFSSPMKYEIAKKSIDYVVSNAVKSGQPLVKLSFHGGGEPTIAWDLLKKSVNYARSLCETNEIKLITYITTNGVLTRNKLEWIQDNISHIQVSIDGPESIQNFHRPKINGDGSFKEVIKTIEFFEINKCDYGLQTVITKHSVNKIEEILDFFDSITDQKSIHIEPVFQCGRCLLTNTEEPGNNIFTRNFINGIKYAYKKKIKIHSSLLRFNFFGHYFCGAGGKNFFITPQGYITSCLEISSVDDKREKYFIYGYYNQGTKDFEINQSRLDYLQSRNIFNLIECQSCAFKWLCAGDCMAKASINGNLFNPANTDRCKLMKLISTEIIGLILENPEYSKAISVETNYL